MDAANGSDAAVTRLTERCGVHYTTLYRVAKGHTYPRPQLLSVLLDEFPEADAEETLRWYLGRVGHAANGRTP